MVRAYFSSITCAFVVAVAPRAQAQLVSEVSRAQDEVAIALRAKEPGGIRLELYDPTKRPPRDLPAAVCFDRCDLVAIPGRYLLRVSGPPGSDVRASKRYVDLKESAEVVVDPPSAFGRYSGLALGIAGTVALSFGTVVLIVGGSDTTRATGLGMTAFGLAATPVGWTLFGVNARPKVKVWRQGQ
jgi:hypothetical protein